MEYKNKKRDLYLVKGYNFPLLMGEEMYVTAKDIPEAYKFAEEILSALKSKNDWGITSVKMFTYIYVKQ